jgi:transcriptional regulator
MYIPEYARIEVSGALAFIRANGFAILVCQSPNGPVATHIPLRLFDSGGTHLLRGHVARANPQWKHWKAGDKVLAIFPGPHTYVSSSWYDHENVPTWNYQAVHVHGTIRLTNAEETLESLRELTSHYEKSSSHPVSVDGMSEDFLKREVRGLVGFELRIEKVEGAFKLSQNRDAKNYQEIIRRLEERGDPASSDVARAMKKADPVKAGLRPDGQSGSA